MREVETTRSANPEFRPHLRAMRLVADEPGLQLEKPAELLVRYPDARAPSQIAKRSRTDFALVMAKHRRSRPCIDYPGVNWPVASPVSLTLGPAWKSVSLAKAREKDAATRKQLKAGEDPVAAEKAARKGIVALPTLRDAAQQAHGEQQAGWRHPKYRAQWLPSLEAYAFPRLGGETVDKIDGPRIRDTLLPV